MCARELHNENGRRRYFYSSQSNTRVRKKIVACRDVLVRVSDGVKERECVDDKATSIEKNKKEGESSGHFILKQKER